MMCEKFKILVIGSCLTQLKFVSRSACMVNNLSSNIFLKLVKVSNQASTNDCSSHSARLSPIHQEDATLYKRKQKNKKAKSEKWPIIEKRELYTQVQLPKVSNMSKELIRVGLIVYWCV